MRSRCIKKQQENKDKSDNANRPRSHKPTGKASHPNQIKSSKNGSRNTARRHRNNKLPNDPQPDRDTQDEDILIVDKDILHLLS